MLPCPHVATLTALHQIFTYGPRAFRFVKIKICCEFIREKRYMTDTFVLFPHPTFACTLHYVRVMLLKSFRCSVNVGIVCLCLVELGAHK